MANNVVGPWFGARVLLSADDLARIRPERFAAAADRHGFINGFASARTAQAAATSYAPTEGSTGKQWTAVRDSRPSRSATCRAAAACN